MRCKAAFGNFVHTFGAYLHFHPFAFGAHYGDVQRLVAIAFGHRQPVAQTLGVGLVHIRYDGVCLPTFQFLLFDFGVQNYANGEQVVYTFERALLLLHLLIDGVDGFGASLDVEVQPRFFQFLLDGSDESGYVSVS